MLQSWRASLQTAIKKRTHGFPSKELSYGAALLVSMSYQWWQAATSCKEVQTPVLRTLICAPGDCWASWEEEGPKLCANQLKFCKSKPTHTVLTGGATNPTSAVDAFAWIWSNKRISSKGKRHASDRTWMQRQHKFTVNYLRIKSRVQLRYQLTDQINLHSSKRWW